MIDGATRLANGSRMATGAVALFNRTPPPQWPSWTRGDSARLGEPPFFRFAVFGRKKSCRRRI